MLSSCTNSCLLVVITEIFFQNTMLTQLIRTERMRTGFFMAVLSFFCLGLSLFRVLYSGTYHFLFLNWNLFLALVPWVFTTLLVQYPAWQQKRWVVAVIAAIWLLFFPNAPYVLTDLFHLSHQSSMPIWFDLILILSFAWTGLLFGFLSLWNLEAVLVKHLPSRVVSLISVLCMFLGSFGIYLGRYLRWNSWDLLHHPGRLLGDVGDRIVNPFEHPRTWGLTLFMGLFLSILFFSFKIVRSAKTT